jgi:hypothetical protein
MTNTLGHLAPADGEERDLLPLLIAARVALAIIGIGMVFFLMRWSSAVKREEIPIPQHYINDTSAGARVVVPQYAGGGRGQGLTGLKAWRFGTIGEHPYWFGACVALLVCVGTGFAVCTWWAGKVKERGADALAPEGGDESPGKDMGVRPDE